jgi:thiamine pyrophosphokinase
VLDRDGRGQEDMGGAGDRLDQAAAELGQQLAQAQAGEDVQRLDLGRDQELVWATPRRRWRCATSM